MPKPVRSASKPRGGLSLKRILGAVVTVAALAFLGARQSNFLVGRSLMIAFGDNEVTYSGAWYRWNGNITAGNVVIDPFGLGPEGAIRFERVEVDTPGWHWIAFTFTDRKFRRTRADRVHIKLSGGSAVVPFDPSLGDLGPFTLASASPFEAEGCLQHDFWTAEELVAMGLRPGETTLEFDYRVEGERLDTSIILTTPGVSRVQLDRRSRVPSDLNALAMDQYPEQVEWERWSVQDQGFVAARNRHCAEQDGVSEQDFVQRHVDTVERLLDISGVGVDTTTWQQYRRFARDGGTLVLGGEYRPPIDMQEFYELRGSAEALRRMHDAALEFGGRRNPIVFEAFEPRPLRGYEEGEDATFALLQKERERDAAEQARLQQAGAVSVPAPPSVAGTDAVVANAPVQPPATEAASGGTDTEAPPAVSEAPAGPVIIPRTAAIVASGDTSSLRRRDGLLGWSALAGLEGRRLRLWTVHSQERVVDLLAVGPDEIRVRARLGGGGAEYSVKREAFVRARLVP